MTVPSPFLWLNGHILPADEACLNPADRGFLLGDGLFETIRVQNGQPCFLADHLDRLESGCTLLHLPMPNRAQLAQGIADLLGVNGCETGSLRLTLTRGPGPRGLAPPAIVVPTLLVTTAPAPDTPPPAVRLIISNQKCDEHSPLCRIKSTSMLPFLLARLEALEKKADDALLCNHQGAIVEASAATFLARLNGVLLTPPLEDGPLPGITRARLLKAGLCQERRLTPHDLPPRTSHRGTNVWLVTALSLTPVASIDGCPLPQDDATHHRLHNFLYNTSASSLSRRPHSPH